MYPVYHQFMDSYPPHHHHHPDHYQSWSHPGYGGPPFNCYSGYFSAPRPPYIPAPPLFYGRGYPAPPVVYPACYNCPPNYAMEVPHYNRHPGEMSGYYGHCCGCPNHQQDYKRTDGNNVKIDEESSDTGQRADDSVDSFDFRSHPSPVVWIPPGPLKNAAGFHSNGCPESAEKERAKFSEEQQNPLNRWLPLIVDSPGFAKQGSDSARKQEHQEDEDKRQFTFPLIWMPYNLDESMKKKDKENADDKNKSPQTKEVINHEDLKTSEKDNVQKVVPVQSIQSTENMEGKVEGSSIKHVNGSKSKPSSPPRSSKLPPICLRVDPPHKKKNGKGSSRSPSPPGDKLHESSRPPVESNAKEAAERDMTAGKCRQESSKDGGQGERKVKTIEVTEGTTGKDEIKIQDLVHSHVSDTVCPESHVVPLVGDGSSANRAEEKVRRNLSEDEAATIIQSVYRGYETRRWETLKKLRQIADVRNEVVKLRNRVSSDTQNDDKWRVAIEETIMNLLLKLDTIQGLHPSIRDVRKSVARELVSLQEKIDSPPLQVREDEDASACSLEPHAEPLGGSAVKTNETGLQSENGAIMNGDQGHPSELPISQVGDDEDTVDSSLGTKAKSLEASSADKNEIGLQSENKATSASDNPAMKGDQGHEFLHAQESGAISHDGNDETAPREMVEISDPKEVVDADSNFKSGSKGEVVMENDSKEKDLTERPQWVFEDGDEDFDIKNEDNVFKDEGSMDSGAKLSNDEVINTDQEKGAQEVMIMIPTPDSSEMDHSSVNQENAQIVENYTKVDSGHESAMETPEDESFITKLGDESEIHDKVSTEMVLLKDSALTGVKSCEDLAALAAKDDKFTQPCDAAMEEDSVYQIELDGKDSEGNLPPPLSPSSPTASQSSLWGDNSTEFNQKLIEENEKLRDMMQRLIEAGNEQLATISNLSGRVKDLEKKLWRKNKLRMRGQGTARYASRKSCMK